MPKPQISARERLSTPWSASGRPVPRTVVQPVLRFLHMEIAAGVLLLVAAIVALVWANSPARESYTALFETEIAIGVGGHVLGHTLQEWINDLLMAVFFFVVGLEIKREIVHGDLRDPKQVALPVLAALGGMVVPALIFYAFNAGTPAAGGWGVPMATDIAFAVGVLALVGRRAPTSLKIFLLTLAIADDIGAIIVIAIFYSSGISFQWLVAALVAVACIRLMKGLKIRALVPYAVFAAFLWFAVLESGVHATIAGVVLGLLTPARPFHEPEAVAATVADPLEGVLALRKDEEMDGQRMLEVSRLAYEGVSPLARLEATLHGWSSFVILPLFALANAGVTLADGALGDAISNPVTLGVVAGLVLGKPIGILLFSWLAVRMRIARLPALSGWLEIAGVGLLAGIGFTVALFVTNLAFQDAATADAAKVGILAASAIAGLLGAAFLLVRGVPGEPQPAPSSHRRDPAEVA